MAYKPTGKPRGRPKTKDYETLVARVPSDLVERVKRYAGIHLQSVSELIRDGLEMRLDYDYELPGNPSHSSSPPESGDAPPMPAYGGPLSVALTSTRLIDAHEAIHDAIKALQHVLAYGEPGEAVIQQSSIPVLQQDTGESQHAAEAPESSLGQALEAEPTVSETPLDQRPVQAESRQPTPADDFDHTKFYLGKLCPKGHMYGDSGLSLLRRHNQHCRECEKEAKRQARARQKAAQAQEG